MKKQVIILIIMAVLFAAGCAESGNEDTNVSSDAASLEGQENSEQTGYQDLEWARNSETHTAIIIKDFDNISTAASDFDIYSLSTSSTYLESHTKSAIEDSDSYGVSPELQLGKDEYRAALVDANNAAIVYKLAAGYIKDGDTESANQAILTATDKMESCGNHFMNTSAIVDTYNKNHGIITETTQYGNEESSQEPAQTTTPVQTSYDDTLWVEYVGRTAIDLSDTMKGITNSINNGEFSSLQGYSEVLMMSTDLAITENENYNISPKCSGANEEWVAGLQDYNAGAKHLRVAAIDAQNGIVNKEEFNIAAELCDSGTDHMQNVNELLNAVS